MAAPDVTYAFYSGEYGGALGEEAFGAALPRARAYVEGRIWPNDPHLAPTPYMRAVCAACDAEAAWGCSGGAGLPSSVTAGTVSMSFGGAGGGTSYEADMARAADGELIGSGLLFMGMG